MSTQYTTEPPATASVLLHTSAGPIPLSIFATQTPLTSRNFLQHVLDGYYDGVLFHRVAAGFVIQTGDPTGTGAGGESIYEQREHEKYDAGWGKLLRKEVGEKIEFGDEVHGRLKFNRRGLVGMAKGDGGYGSQFFITLGDARGELEGRCTMFGRVEAEGIYNMVKVAEGEVGEGTERPVFPEKILRAEVLQMPSGEVWEGMKAREKVVRTVEAREPVKKKVVKKKAAKTLLSFGEEEGEEGDVVVKLKKAKFNTALIDAGDVVEEKPTTNGHAARKANSPPPARRKQKSPSPERTSRATTTTQPPGTSRSPEATYRRKPSLHDPTTQLPLRDPESPSRSASPDSPIRIPNRKTTKASLNDEIAALKASMRRDVGPAPASKRTKSALEAMIPATSTRGRKRPRPGDNSTKEDKSALAMLNAFKSRLESTQEKPAADTEMPDAAPSTNTLTFESKRLNGLDINSVEAEDDEEAHLCDLHFIVNCQSCSRWDEDDKGDAGDEDDDKDGKWMAHALSFGKDQLGKDLNWKRRNEALEELVVIDPREKAGQILAAEREKMRERKMGKGKGKR